MQRFLILNPRSGTGSPSAEELRDAARERGIDVHFLEEGDDLPEVARRANADVLGMAGGDGSLAAVAGVAIEQDIPFVCIPFGTRNHFARDIGLDRDGPDRRTRGVRRRRTADRCRPGRETASS